MLVAFPGRDAAEMPPVLRSGDHAAVQLQPNVKVKRGIILAFHSSLVNSKAISGIVAN